MPWTRAIPSLPLISLRRLYIRFDIPDGEDATGLGKANFFLHAPDFLFEDGGHLGGRGLCLGGIVASGIKQSWAGPSLREYC
jgi:hypothetical protein